MGFPLPRSNRWRSASVALAFAFGAAACGGGSSTDSAAVPSTEPAASDGAAAPEETVAEEETASAFPDIVLDTTAGSQIDFNSLEGQDVVLWFWAPW